jgi:predicted  nucleic acid-binding Zn-ribbon protein
MKVQDTEVALAAAEQALGAAHKRRGDAENEIEDLKRQEDDLVTRLGQALVDGDDATVATARQALADHRQRITDLSVALPHMTTTAQQQVIAARKAHSVAQMPGKAAGLKQAAVDRVLVAFLPVRAAKTP